MNGSIQNSNMHFQSSAAPIQSIKKKRRFTKEEDELIKQLVALNKNTNWETIAKYVPGRTARQCRDRYNSYLFKEAEPKPWTPEEDLIIVSKYQEFGPHWVKISQSLPGRTGNNVKNRWHKSLKQFHGIEHNVEKQERRSKKAKWRIQSRLNESTRSEISPLQNIETKKESFDHIFFS